MTPYENLARAIVTQAIADYIPYYTALEKYRAMDTSLFDKETLKKYNKDLAKLERDFDELVDFFYSPWFAQLTDLNPATSMPRSSVLRLCAVWPLVSAPTIVACRITPANLYLLWLMQYARLSTLKMRSGKTNTGFRKSAYFSLSL